MQSLVRKIFYINITIQRYYYICEVNINDTRAIGYNLIIECPQPIYTVIVSLPIIGIYIDFIHPYLRDAPRIGIMYVILLK